MVKLLTKTVMAVLLASGAAVAQDYPTKTITMIIPYSPGGSTDLLGRSLANELQKIWGQTVVVENRPGAGSMIGTAHLSQAANDGYTLLLNTAAHSTAPAIQKSLPFDPHEDITSIMMVATSPYVVVAGPHVEADTFEQFIADAKENPRFFATAGVGSSSHFTAELLIQQGDLPADVVHFGGGGEANTSLMGGHADIYISTTASVMPYVNNKQVKAIGVLGPDRYELLPDVQSSGEVGIEGIEIDGWIGLFGPGGMDPELVKTIHEGVTKAMSTDAFKTVLETNYVRPGDTTPEAFEEQVTREMQLWVDLAEQRGISGQ